MAKRKRNQPTRPQRETPASRYRQVLEVVRLLTPVSHYLDSIAARARQPRPLQALEDRRRWHPERWGQPTRATVRAATRVVVKPSPGPVLTSRLAYADPKRIALCNRRQTRKEVIHALGKAGGGNKPPTRKPSSEISC